MFVITTKPGTITTKTINTLNKKGFYNFRINFARNTIQDNVRQLELLKTKNNIVFIDLPGEKWRINYIKDIRIVNAGEEITIKKGNAIDCSFSVIAINEKLLFDIIQEGDTIILGDTNAKFMTIEISDCLVKMRCIKGGKLYNKAGITIQGKYVEKKHLCSSDREVLAQLPFDKIDYICVSFTDCADIISELRKDFYIPNNTRIIAKIESVHGVNNLESILKVSDGILLARSDLSKFYTLQELSQLAEQFRSITTNEKKVVFASNYFINSVKNHIVDDVEKYYYIHDYCLKPDYIYINETYYSEDIFSVLELYTSSIKTI